MNQEHLIYMEWIGYLASVLVVISLMMSSVVRLRWLNLAGAAVFSLYGFGIGALPVGILNLFLTFVNLYYLIRIYRHQELFKILPVEPTNQYLEFFIDFYKNDISLYFPDFYEKFIKGRYPDNGVCLLLLRNTATAGIFCAVKTEDKELQIVIDYVTPEYRDFKAGKYIYSKQSGFFINMGITRLISVPHNNKKYVRYLKKMGFKQEIKDGNLRYYRATS